MAKSKLAQVSAEHLPVHIGLIMDGNGRWAAKRGLPRTAGHKKGAEVFGEIARHCRKIGIRYLTVYAFSTENWKRPADEVEALMKLLYQYLNDTFKHQDEDARICFLGDPTPLAPKIQQLMQRIQQESAANTAITVNVALNYGGRDEIVHAARRLAQQCVQGSLTPEQIDEPLFSDYLYTAGQPDPDLIVRPSGELRTSNFLPWQAAYAELVFMDVLWPDFSPAHLEEAILQYLTRTRRFGGI